MEIVRRGKPPSERKYEGTCSQCKTVVRFARHEAEWHAGDYRDPRETNWLSIACPVCPCSITCPEGAYLKEDQ